MCARLVISAFVVLTIALANAQSDGRYRPVPQTLFAAPRLNTVRQYQPLTSNNNLNDGKYHPDSNGQYRSGNDGKYVHVDAGYKHDARPGGDYTGDAGRYKHVTGPQGGSGSAYKPYANAPQQTRQVYVQGPAVAAAPRIGENLSAGKGTGKGGNGWNIVRLEDTQNEDSYRYLYETENGILAEEAGKVEKLAANDDGLRSQGFFEYTGDDGKLYHVDYVADERGFVPVGAHIPTPPPYIAKTLAYIAAHPSRK